MSWRKRYWSLILRNEFLIRSFFDYSEEVEEEMQSNNNNNNNKMNEDFQFTYESYEFYRLRTSRNVKMLAKSHWWEMFGWEFDCFAETTTRDNIWILHGRKELVVEKSKLDSARQMISDATMTTQLPSSSSGFSTAGGKDSRWNRSWTVQDRWFVMRRRRHNYKTNHHHHPDSLQRVEETSRWEIEVGQCKTDD